MVLVPLGHLGFTQPALSILNFKLGIILLAFKLLVILKLFESACERTLVLCTAILDILDLVK